MDKSKMKTNTMIAEFLKEEIVPSTWTWDYDFSWDSLMPVLKKIDELNYELPEDSNLIGNITEGLVSIDIEITYEAVCKFIEYYNGETELCFKCKIRYNKFTDPTICPHCLTSL